ncbi:MAG: ADP-ribosylglycohydrolase family protein [Deltaproteobacteria bacterium]|jgi:type I restriction enzyme M protein|nr:ADP-ribosylglycohydrolase family protein [Deltaproteobacteria bacterium]
MMIGAIIGDIVGSRFEFNNHRDKSFDLFTEKCFATDDSVMTLAVAEAIMKTAETRPCLEEFDGEFHKLLAENAVGSMQKIGRAYADSGYGARFMNWVFSEDPKPYDSYGNGAGMRVSPAGFLAKNEREALDLADTVTSVTHNHPEGIKGARATALSIFLARSGSSKDEIRRRVTGEYYPLDFTIDGIRGSYKFNESCQKTVPQAIECFLESTSFEDAIRIGVSLGGDTDTIGAINGAIAEAFYGVPQDVEEKALSYLDDRLRKIYDDWGIFLAGRPGPGRP